MSSILRTAWLIAGKDVRIEARTGEIVLSTSFFGVLVTVIASLSFYLDDQTARRIAPGVLWVSIAFAGVLAMGRSWAREREHDVMRGLLLTPSPRAGIYLGKAIGALVFLLVVEAILLPLVALFFHIELLPVLLPVATLLLLGTIGFVAAGTLFSAMTVRTRARELMLSIVLFPLVSPALLAGVVATREVLGGATFMETLGWIRVLGAFDLVFLAAGVLLFDSLMAD
jgi:heme exporter protein B